MKNRWHVTGAIVNRRRGSGEYHNVILTESDRLERVHVCVDPD